MSRMGTEERLETIASTWSSGLVADTTGEGEQGACGWSVVVVFVVAGPCSWQAIEDCCGEALLCWLIEVFWLAAVDGDLQI